MPHESRITNHASLTACDAFDLPEPLPERVRIPFGTWVHPKAGEFTIDEHNARQMADNFAGLGVDVVIDYEHQTLSGAKAPAAGWIKGLGVEADGLYAAVEWTEEAQRLIAAKEYRYWSPVFDFTAKDPRTGNRIGAVLHSLALTNTPLLAGDIHPLTNRRECPATEPERSDPMDQSQWAERIGLAPDATEEQIAERLAELAQPPARLVPASVTAALDLPDDAAEQDACARIAALKDPDGFVAQEEYDSLRRELTERVATALVDRALAECKVAPAQRDWARDYALRDPDGFEQFVACAPRILGPKAAAQPAAAPAVLTREERAVCEQLHIEPARFAQTTEALP